MRIAAFVAICLGGLAGGVIGYSLVELQCDGDCALPLGLGILAGAVVAAGGMSIVAVLVMRAMGEWRALQDRRPVTVDAQDDSIGEPLALAAGRRRRGGARPTPTPASIGGRSPRRRSRAAPTW